MRGGSNPVMKNGGGGSRTHLSTVNIIGVARWFSGFDEEDEANVVFTMVVDG
jgi:hypothetical protein